MKQEARRYLKESGYLDSPVGRFVWRGASPNLRHHLRRFLVLSLFFAAPFAGINTSLTFLRGADRLLLGGFYLLGLMALFLVLDLIASILVRLPNLERLWENNRALHLGTALPAGLILLAAGYFLEPAVMNQPPTARLLIWAAMAPASWIAARALGFLVVARLYWHGIRPPRYREHTILTVSTLAVILLFQLFHQKGLERPALTLQSRPPLILLGFDVPRDRFEDYANLIPHRRRDHVTTQQHIITDFWTELGTGVDAASQAASLVSYETRWFASGLNRRDPTQRPFLAIFEFFGATTPRADGTRYHKYFWEILDNYGAKTFAFNYWHSFPAVGQNGGVLSERWSEDHSGPPYSRGLEPALPSVTPPPGVPADHPSVQREVQTWTQLAIRAGRADFDLCIAYFPLADQLGGLGVAPAEKTQVQQALLDFRAAAVTSLLARLPEGTEVGILLASGKSDADREPIVFEFLSTQSHDQIEPFDNPLQIAPTILGIYGLPPGRLMTESRLKSTPPDQKRVDYGEAIRRPLNEEVKDGGYYEELKSLGYVQ